MMESCLWMCAQSIRVDVTNEVDAPTFRISFWRTSPGLACREYELTGADVDEVIRWAENNKGHADTYVVGVLTSRPGPHGEGDVILTRIKGTDPSRSDDDGSGTPAVASG
jgi:hypothetical protein